MNIVGGKLAPLNSKEMRRFTFSRFSLVRSQTHVRNPHFLQNRQVLNSDTRYPRNLNLVSSTPIRYSDAGTLEVRELLRNIKILKLHVPCSEYRSVLVLVIYHTIPLPGVPLHLVWSGLVRDVARGMQPN